MICFWLPKIFLYTGIYRKNVCVHWNPCTFMVIVRNIGIVSDLFGRYGKLHCHFTFQFPISLPTLRLRVNIFAVNNGRIPFDDPRSILQHLIRLYVMFVVFDYFSNTFRHSPWWDSQCIPGHHIFAFLTSVIPL